MKAATDQAQKDCRGGGGGNAFVMLRLTNRNQNLNILLYPCVGPGLGAAKQTLCCSGLRGATPRCVVLVHVGLCSVQCCPCGRDTRFLFPSLADTCAWLGICFVFFLFAKLHRCVIRESMGIPRTHSFVGLALAPPTSCLIETRPGLPPPNKKQRA